MKATSEIRELEIWDSKIWIKKNKKYLGKLIKQKIMKLQARYHIIIT